MSAINDAIAAWKKKYSKDCQAGDSLPIELEVAMPVLKSLQSISNSPCHTTPSTPTPTLYPRKFSRGYLCFHVSDGV